MGAQRCRKEPKIFYETGVKRSLKKFKKKSMESCRKTIYLKKKKVLEGVQQN
jgi:hypothetical protein